MQRGVGPQSLRREMGIITASTSQGCLGLRGDKAARIQLGPWCMGNIFMRVTITIVVVVVVVTLLLLLIIIILVPRPCVGNHLR